ncbi:hypothetical protein OAC86_00575 [bacterium]|nr:hypothetical protein [bacterium]
MANLLNEAEIKNTWAPIISEATGINESSKLAWMSTYCHNHKLYEDANIMSLSNNPGPMNIGGMGAVSFPSAISNGGSNGDTGSGDKSPTLLPLAMQVAAQTIGLDLVPVIPMAGPMGLLSYLDFVYEGGRTDNKLAPTYIKADIGVSAAGGDVDAGTSRIDGKPIIQVVDVLTAGEANIAARYAGAELVAALEDHIPGFSGAGVSTGTADYEPMTRVDGERLADKVMGLSLFSKSVAAETFQVAAAVTREQVQDLKQFGVDAVAQVEAVLTNELTQSINTHILGKMRAIAKTGISTVALDYTQGGNTYGDVNRRILTNILAAANLIANQGRRGAGNFAVVDAKVASALQAVAGFVPNPMANTFNQVAGAIYPVGSVAGINVYTDPNQVFDGVTVAATGTPGEADFVAAYQTHNVLVGRKGDGNGSGLVFMPYLMAESVQMIAEGTMAPKVAVKSRYALVEAGFHPELNYQKFDVTGISL